MPDTEELRGQIEAIDEQIIDLIATRMEIADELAKAKKKSDQRYWNEEKEREVKQHYRELCEEVSLTEYEASQIAEVILSISKERQKHIFERRVRTMDESVLRMLLEDVASGRVSPDEAVLSIRSEPYEDLGYAKVDLHRGIRQGVPEVVFGANKTPEQIVGISNSLLSHGCGSVLITRLSAEAADAVSAELPLDYDPVSRIAVAGTPTEERRGRICVVTAGTSDIPVAEEAARTAEALGNAVVRIYDAGVSGLHRLLSRSEDVMSANAVVAVAGMEGALASVVGGMADCPVIAVPTSVGYGVSFGGLAALLAMLNSCSSSVSVVNIDNGFGAGYIASLINRSACRR